VFRFGCPYPHITGIGSLICGQVGIRGKVDEELTIKREHDGTRNGYGYDEVEHKYKNNINVWLRTTSLMITN